MSHEKNLVPKLENQEDKKLSLLDLPDATMDCILERLSPHDLCRVAQVCTILRIRSRNDYLWKKFVERKWSRVVGDVAHQEWQYHKTKMTNAGNLFLQLNLSGSCGTFSAWPFLGNLSYLEICQPVINLIKNCSKKALFMCLETGRFWFPAQLYTSYRSPISCYDAIVSYDSRTDTFRARSLITGWLKLTEANIMWNRVRLPPPEAFAIGYYKFTCLSDLKPGDYIEIQTKIKKTLAYRWSFAVVDHMDSCDKDVNHCHCQYSDTLVVEFMNLPQSTTTLRRAMLNKNIYKERYSSEVYFFGGIRKLNNKEEIEKWKAYFNLD